MSDCQIREASHFAFPRGLSPVEDRRMTLDLVCKVAPSYSVQLYAAAQGRGRKGAPARTYFLCENHAQLVEQIDRELVEEEWRPALLQRPSPTV